MAVNFSSSKDSEETCTINTKSEIMMGNETDEVIEGLFESLLQRYKKD